MAIFIQLLAVPHVFFQNINFFNENLVIWIKPSMLLRRAFSTTRTAAATVVNNSIYDAKHIQSELLKSYNRKTGNLFLAINSKPLAEQVAKAIGDHLQATNGDDPNKVILEASPGNGLLTEQLLKRFPSQRIRVFEHNANRLVSLKKLQKLYGDGEETSRLEIVDMQILDFCNGHYKLLNLSRDDLSKACFDGIPVKTNWSNKITQGENVSVLDSSITFTSVLSPFIAREFLTFLVYSLAHFDSFFITGPTEFFLFVPLPAYKGMVSRPTRNLKYYTSFTININSLFDYQAVEELTPSEQLYGVGQVKIEGRTVTVVPSDYFSFTNERTFKTKEDFVLLHIKPKTLVQQLEADFLINYVTFVKQSFTKRSNYAIRYYEKHFPGCAVELIGLGISYFKTLGDLTPEEMFAIFSHLYGTPQYQTSIFKELC